MPNPERLAAWLLSGVNRAVHRYDLIRDGDRIAVGVSGGKDSRVLLDLLRRGVDIPGHYELIAIHVDGSEVGLPDLKPFLRPWLERLALPYTIVPLTQSPGEKLPLSCFRCSWNRRKALFLAAEQMGCNVVALGHHADDAAITTLMSILYKGKVEPLEPHLSYFSGRFRLIRPLILLGEREIARYARLRGWMLPPELECPRASTTRRAQLEAFLRSFPPKEQEQIRANLLRLSSEKGEKNDNHIHL